MVPGGVEALREEVPPGVSVIGIMEASIYAARMLGGRFGIISTAVRSRWMQEDAVHAYGLDSYYVGSEATGLGVLELEMGDGAAMILVSVLRYCLSARTIGSPSFANVMKTFLS